MNHKIDVNTSTSTSQAKNATLALLQAEKPLVVPAISPVLAELHHADHIIKVMLNALTIQQKAKVAEQLEAAGVAGDGMTRHQERAAAIAVATAAPTSIDATAPRMLDIEARACDAAAQAADIAHLLQATFEKLDDLNAADGSLGAVVAAANCFTTCAARNVELIREATADIIALAQEGGAA
ncbi:hypothetical protein HUX88_28975 [Duganella sp. BJB1802]|uniref:hypothetical protein n=1 Tax=Duganella sp. BJB1802 TaxID=2744575 RepID=UPI001594189D|nr:hypothetical protein [Duganella sp. BJB1802]NVD74522.1 hypothetical protein [Duganella sp. BJB1802]